MRIQYFFIKLFLIFVILTITCNSPKAAGADMPKVSIGKELALYPSLVTVVGAEVKGKINWFLVYHTGVIGHKFILVSMNHITPIRELLPAKNSL